MSFHEDIINIEEKVGILRYNAICESKTCVFQLSDYFKAFKNAIEMKFNKMHETLIRENLSFRKLK